MSNSSNKGFRIGFVGLGDMGSGMAKSLSMAGLEPLVFDIKPEAIAEAKTFGARPAVSLEDLINTVDHIHLCLTFEEQVSETILGANGIASLGRPGQLVIVHSTVLPSAIERYSVRLKQSGIDVIDAQVSGGALRTHSGTAMESGPESLTIMVGGVLGTVRRSLHTLETMGTVIHVGQLGAGAATKLANNAMNFCNRIAYLEGLQMAEAYGVSEEKLNEVVTRSTGMSYAQVNRERNDRRGQHPSFSAEELPYRYSKDLRYATQMALEQQLSAPVTAMCSQIAPSVFAARWRRVATRIGGEQAE